jgi:hypothetical protein
MNFNINYKIGTVFLLFGFGFVCIITNGFRTIK